ncbi:hypothetical protein EMIHUDRAFT_230078 [Emiliania huxleyi CCMP1516]|uniref:J domain-containing protein n=2 Tax=Emiliania huxleyi TaxID=2903 RepID=A0A0D3KB05_EMIH1|nr:hypothetical protein EMIHUDRAFT_230078 [Emiliania huxleyi CCMP1516]EOD32940.1 hypothetical protein EMIHUDRAFT_230078 [Emiliania huxleyi CCMP1516]|eukprot:XP_005785369.1 hypothetical protein EMIHUDRAFT_230078 [Emiliania huxleyi CCMP1516]
MSALRIASALAAAPDPYAVLQLKRDASAADVKKAFRTAVLLVHPDKAMGCAGAAAAFEAVEAASALLLDAGARREWDAKHKQQSFIERYGSGAAEAGGEAIAPPFSVRLGDVVEAKTATLRFDGYDDSAVVPLSQIRPPRPAQSDAVGSAEEGEAATDAFTRSMMSSGGLGLLLDEENRVVGLAAGGQAEREGVVRVGEVILAVDGERLRGRPLGRGEGGTAEGGTAAQGGKAARVAGAEPEWRRDAVPSSAEEFRARHGCFTRGEDAWAEYYRQQAAWAAYHQHQAAWAAYYQQQGRPP